MFFVNMPQQTTQSESLIRLQKLLLHLCTAQKGCNWIIHVLSLRFSKTTLKCGKVYLRAIRFQTFLFFRLNYDLPTKQSYEKARYGHQSPYEYRVKQKNLPSLAQKNPSFAFFFIVLHHDVCASKLILKVLLQR